MQSGPGTLPTFLYYFVGTTLIVVLLINQGVGDTALISGVGNSFTVGVLFGLLAGGVGTYFNRHELLTIPIKNQKTFAQTLETVLTEMGFAEAELLDQVKVYERPIPSRFFTGKLFVQVEKETATLSGRSRLVRSLQKRLET
jgi:hypothetical protein